MAACVLVADDEPAITEVMGRILRAAGHDVITAGSGMRALELARAERPDIALLDVMLPGMDGREVSRRIRQDPELARMPIVLFSSMDESDVDWRGAGADAFLQKAFDILALPALVDRMLDAR